MAWLLGWTTCLESRQSTPQDTAWVPLTLNLWLCRLPSVSVPSAHLHCLLVTFIPRLSICSIRVSTFIHPGTDCQKSTYMFFLQNCLHFNHIDLLIWPSAPCPVPLRSSFFMNLVIFHHSSLSKIYYHLLLFWCRWLPKYILFCSCIPVYLLFHSCAWGPY